MIEEMRLAGELGTLLQVELSLADDIRRARAQYLAEQERPSLFPDLRPKIEQGKLDLSGVTDETRLPGGRGDDPRGAPALRRVGRWCGCPSPALRRRRGAGRRADRPRANAVRRGADESALRRRKPCGEEGVREGLPAHEERHLRGLRRARHPAPSSAAACSGRSPRGRASSSRASRSGARRSSSRRRRRSSSRTSATASWTRRWSRPRRTASRRPAYAVKTVFIRVLERQTRQSRSAARSRRTSGTAATPV